MLKNWCFRTVVLEKTLESLLDRKEIKPMNPKGNQPSIFIGRADAEAPILWPPDAKNWLIGKDPDARKDWRQEEKRTTEDEMVGWHHQLDVHEFEQALGVGDEQGSLACYSPWGHKEMDNWVAELSWSFKINNTCKLCVCVCVCVCVQACLTLWDPIDCNPLGSSVLGIFQARILEWGAISFSRVSSCPRDQTPVSSISCLLGGFFTTASSKKPWCIITHRLKLDL